MQASAASRAAGQHLCFRWPACQAIDRARSALRRSGGKSFRALLAGYGESHGAIEVESISSTRHIPTTPRSPKPRPVGCWSFDACTGAPATR